MSVDCTTRIPYHARKDKLLVVHLCCELAMKLLRRNHNGSLDSVELLKKGERCCLVIHVYRNMI
jgi:hypothetical protein